MYRLKMLDILSDSEKKLLPLGYHRLLVINHFFHFVDDFKVIVGQILQLGVQTDRFAPIGPILGWGGGLHAIEVKYCIKHSA